MLLVLTASAWGFEPAHHVSRFEDYPVKKIYTGVPAAPKITTPSQRRYRTVIRQGVAKGWGVERDDKDQPGPNFAGRMIVVQWSAGSPGMMMAMVDATTGEVYLPPLGMNETFALPFLVLGESVGGNPRLTFRRDSRLMVVRTTPDYFKKHHQAYDHYFFWEDSRWRLLHREPLD